MQNYIHILCCLYDLSQVGSIITCGLLLVNFDYMCWTKNNSSHMKIIFYAQVKVDFKNISIWEGLIIFFLNKNRMFYKISSL